MGVKQKTKSLKRTNNALSDTFMQLQVLNGKEVVDHKFESFASKVGDPIRPRAVEVFQLNIGKLCNQTCGHCHVDAGPDRKEENMDKATLAKCLEIITKYKIPTVDITGGAPEMNAHFRWFVEECTAVGAQVIDRCNLTIIKANPSYADLPQFLAKNKVHIVGYGIEGTGLQLDLVFNPSGAFLPGDQASLQEEFKRQLKRRYDIEFNNLFAITNLPISRFLDYLLESGNYESYMTELVDAYNPDTIDGLMCRNTISVSWDGYIYDCDFNQMLDLKVAANSQHLDDFDMEALLKRDIVLNQHCYGCTAGAGSSCGGEIV